MGMTCEAVFLQAPPRVAPFSYNGSWKLVACECVEFSCGTVSRPRPCLLQAAPIVSVAHASYRTGSFGKKGHFLIPALKSPSIHRVQSVTGFDGGHPHAPTELEVSNVYDRDSVALTERHGSPNHLVWSIVIGATVAERLALSPPTKANRAKSPAGSPDFRKWESCRTIPLIGGFSRGSPVSPTPSFRRRSIFTSNTLIGSQDFVTGPIEHLWDELDRRVRTRQVRPKCIAQLVEWLQEEWRRIPVDVLQTLVESMPDRVAAVITARELFLPPVLPLAVKTMLKRDARIVSMCYPAYFIRRNLIRTIIAVVAGFPLASRGREQCPLPWSWPTHDPARAHQARLVSCNLRELEVMEISTLALASARTSELTRVQTSLATSGIMSARASGPLSRQHLSAITNCNNPLSCGQGAPARHFLCRKERPLYFRKVWKDINLAAITPAILVNDWMERPLKHATYTCETASRSTRVRILVSGRAFVWVPKGRGFSPNGLPATLEFYFYASMDEEDAVTWKRGEGVPPYWAKSFHGEVGSSRTSEHDLVRNSPLVLWTLCPDRHRILGWSPITALDSQRLRRPPSPQSSPHFVPLHVIGSRRALEAMSANRLLTVARNILCNKATVEDDVNILIKMGCENFGVDLLLICGFIPQMVEISPDIL
ncbi:hypothetical protein PR048_030517 [Dryococelus australis]|uniref:Uncharacterized protein n=1 Tax=Dryococelus australis TaxID=614101 RepID=A0ABQ9GBT1_9NEOP|nr:hypothetical protein PR048_030517 [Dryococelus australis]